MLFEASCPRLNGSVSAMHALLALLAISDRTETKMTAAKTIRPQPKGNSDLEEKQLCWRFAGHEGVGGAGKR